VFRNLIN